MVRMIVPAGLIGLLFVTAASAGGPCRCSTDWGCLPLELFRRERDCEFVPKDAKHALEMSSDVFAGEVVGMEKVGFDLIVIFQVDTIWKGDNFQQYVGVATPTGRAAGGYPFRKGGHYLVYCERIPSPTDQPARVTHTRTRTQPLEWARKNDLLALGEGRKY